MIKLNERRKNYSKISSTLSCLGNEPLLALLSKATPLHKGIGGTSTLLSLEGLPVFVKKVPLTDIELLTQNQHATANIFNLPLFYQYGVGSTGFGAWRELATHVMTTDWMLANECVQFPLLYHWRILENDPSDIHFQFWDDIENYTHYWENNSAIRARIEALNKSTSHITLFLEYVPQNLYQWLTSQITKGANEAQIAIEFVKKNLFATNRFMHNHGLIHFDAHFENILTDGKLLYLSDFGLALSSKFELTPQEQNFLTRHQNYDDACAVVNLLHAIITALFGKEDWEVKLKDYIAHPQKHLTPTTNEMIKHYAPIALAMDAFFQELQKKSKLTAYPVELIEKLLAYTCL
ncbi:MAG: hypothetical protein JSR17_09490 [Proteobacteria bacterium]|nr:hypothetical protein [Pseudomonadota bacterium]